MTSSRAAKAEAPQATSWLRVLLLWPAGIGAAAQFAKIAILFPDLSTRYAQAALGPDILMSILGLSGLLGGASAGLIIAWKGPAGMLLAALGSKLPVPDAIYQFIIFPQAANTQTICNIWSQKESDMLDNSALAIY